LPSLERFEVSHSTTATIPRGVWLAGGEPRGGRAAIEYLKRRADAVLSAVDATPAGVTLPSTIAAELGSIAKSLSARDPGATQISRIQALLKDRSEQNVTGQSQVAVRGAGAATAGLTESILTAAMSSAEARISPNANSPRPMILPRRPVVWIAVIVWFVSSLIVLRRALKLATRWQIADRLAEHAAVTLFAVGLLWWLFLSPSVLGLLMCILVAVSRLLQGRVRAAMTRSTG
jgi:hypothetical protein